MRVQDLSDGERHFQDNDGYVESLLHALCICAIDAFLTSNPPTVAAGRDGAAAQFSILEREARRRGRDVSAGGARPMRLRTEGAAARPGWAPLQDARLRAELSSYAPLLLSACPDACFCFYHRTGKFDPRLRDHSCRVQECRSPTAAWL